MFELLKRRSFGDDDDGGTTRQPKTTDGPSQEPSCLWYMQYWVTVLLVLAPYALIIVLFVMVSKINNDTTNNSFTSQALTSSQFSVTGSSFTPGTVVSLTSSGELQAGAGTSVYQNIAAIEAKCPSYVSMDAIYDNAYLVSFADKGAGTATLEVVMIGSQPNLAAVKSSTQTTNYMYEIATQTNGLFVGICQDVSSTLETAFIVAGTVDTSFAIHMGSTVQYTNTYSLNPYITRLSDTTFAITYYVYSPSSMTATRFGSVNPTTLVVSLSEQFTYADNSNYGLYAGIEGMSSSQYLLIYFDSYTPTYDIDGSGPMNVIVATVSGDPALGTSNITFSAVQTLADSAMSFYFDCTRLDNNTAVVAYVDANNNYGITTQVIQLATNLGSQAVVFGSSWVMTTGLASAYTSVGLMDIDIEVLNTENEFMVLYSDVSNGGAMTATAGQLTLSGDLIRSSPDFVLNKGNPNMESVYSWGAIATGVNTPLNSQTAILTSLATSSCAVDAVTTFSLLNILPTPYGVVTTFTAGLRGTSSVEVVVTGAVTMDADLTTLTKGMTYYTNTMGQPVSGGVYHGREGSATGGDSAVFYYIDDVASDTLITLNSKIGVATAQNTLLVQLE